MKTAYSQKKRIFHCYIKYCGNANTGMQCIQHILCHVNREFDNTLVQWIIFLKKREKERDSFEDVYAILADVQCMYRHALRILYFIYAVSNKHTGKSMTSFKSKRIFQEAKTNRKMLVDMCTGMAMYIVQDSCEAHAIVHDTPS